MPKYVYTLGRCGQDEGGCVCWLALALYLTDRWSKIPLICPLLCTMYYVLQFPNIQYKYVFLYISKRLYGCSMWVLTWLHYLLIILLSVVRWFVPLNCLLMVFPRLYIQYKSTTLVRILTKKTSTYKGVSEEIWFTKKTSTYKGVSEEIWC